MSELEARGGARDEALMAAVRDGDTAALGELFERYHGQLFRFVARLCGDPVAAEDVVQEVFLRVLRHRRTYRADQPFRPWLYRIARNAWVDALRARERRDARLTAANPREPETPDVSFARAEARKTLREALDRLPVDRREILLLARFEDLPYREIASVLDISESNVKVRVHRALNELRELLTRAPMTT